MQLSLCEQLTLGLLLLAVAGIFSALYHLEELIYVTDALAAAVRAQTAEALAAAGSPARNAGAARDKIHALRSADDVPTL